MQESYIFSESEFFVDFNGLKIIFELAQAIFQNLFTLECVGKITILTLDSDRV